MSSAGTRGETAQLELRSRSFLHASFFATPRLCYLLRFTHLHRPQLSWVWEPVQHWGSSAVSGHQRTWGSRRAYSSSSERASMSWCAWRAGGGRALGGAQSAGARTCSVALACRCGTAPLRPRSPRHWRTQRASIAPTRPPHGAPPATSPRGCPPLVLTMPPETFSTS